MSKTPDKKSKRSIEEVDPPLESTPPKRPKPDEAAMDSNASNQRLTRTQFFLAVCELLRQKSNDPYFTVGCCLVRSDTRQLQSIGYNGFLVGENNDPEVWAQKANKQKSAGQRTPEEVREDYLQHAETNAIHFCAESDLVDTIAYVSCLPCSNCCAKLIQKRVPAVVYNITQEKYLQPTLDAFKLAGVYVMYVKIFLSHHIANLARSYNDIAPVDNRQVCIKLVGYDNPKKDWEVLFMAIAVLAAQRCEATVEKREGCVIVKDKQILGYGYSGYPQLMMKKPQLIPDFPTISAVQNALCFTTNVTGATVYCTHFPTREAVKELIQRGVSVVKYLHGVDPKIKDVTHECSNKKEISLREDYQKVIKLAVKNPISLRAFGKGSSRVDTDTTDLNASMDMENVPSFAKLGVMIIDVTAAEEDYKEHAPESDRNGMKIVIPPSESTPERTVEKDNMKEWLNSPDSIRTIKLKRENTKEIKNTVQDTPK